MLNAPAQVMRGVLLPNKPTAVGFIFGLFQTPLVVACQKTKTEKWGKNKMLKKGIK